VCRTFPSATISCNAFLAVLLIPERPGAIDDNPRLESDLIGPGYELDSKVRIQLESKDDMKKRSVDSPDDADALALTFARQVAVTQIYEPTRTV
jgi:hypothetical protein